MLVIFGFFWLGFVVIGIVMDGNLDINYCWSDVVVMGILVGIGMLLFVLFGICKMCFGEDCRMRFRIIDIIF